MRAQGYSPGGPLPEAWKEELAITTDDRDWRLTPPHIEDWLDWYADAESTDAWTYVRTTNPAGPGQEGERVVLHQKWWILLLPLQEEAYLVRPTYNRPIRPRSRTGSPRSARREGTGLRQRPAPQPAPGPESPFGPPTLGRRGKPRRTQPLG